MDTSQSHKRPASPIAPDSSTKKQKSRYNKVSVNLTQRLSKAFAEHMTTSLNDTHRRECLNTLSAENSSEAGEKVGEMLKKFKEAGKHKASNGSPEINGNS